MKNRATKWKAQQGVSPTEGAKRAKANKIQKVTSSFPQKHSGGKPKSRDKF